MPGKEFLPHRERDRPIVGPAAPVLRVASVMSRQKSPVHHRSTRLLGAPLPLVTGSLLDVAPLAVAAFVGTSVLIAHRGPTGSKPPSAAPRSCS